MCIGEKLIFLDFFFKLGGETTYGLFCNDLKNIPVYKSCVERLCSSAYYSDLKNGWNNLTSRPALTVITGTIGHLFTYIPGFSSDCDYNSDTILKEPFDGLVKFSEQANIQNAKLIHLVDKNLPCYSDRGFAKSVCYSQSGLYISCRKKCTLSSISFSGTVIDVLFNLISNAINGKNIHDFANYDVVVAIMTGLENVPFKYMDYYNIYSYSYNHDFIRTNFDTISLLLALLN